MKKKNTYSIKKRKQNKERLERELRYQKDIEAHRAAVRVGKAFLIACGLLLAGTKNKN